MGQVFIAISLTLEGESIVQGPEVGRLIGLGDFKATLTMLRTPDGQGIELDKYHTSESVRFGHVYAPVHTLGLRRIMFAVDDIHRLVAHMQSHGAELIGQMLYGQAYKLAYIRGPEGIIVALAEQLGNLPRPKRIHPTQVPPSPFKSHSLNHLLTPAKLRLKLRIEEK